MKLITIDQTGNKSHSQVSDELFGVRANAQLLSQAIRVYIENGHQATSLVQSRSDVSLTKHKLYRQKGTGGARHGAKSAPIFVGGGVAFGPVADKSQNLKLSAAQKRQALKVALSLQAPQTVVMTNLEQLGVKTKIVDQAFKQALPANVKLLVIMSKVDVDQVRGMTNIPYVTIVNASQVNTLQVCQAGAVAISPEAVLVLENRLLKSTASTTKQAKSITAKQTQIKSAKKAVATETNETKQSVKIKPTATAKTAVKTEAKSEAKTMTNSETKVKAKTDKPATKQVAAKAKVVTTKKSSPKSTAKTAAKKDTK